MPENDLTLVEATEELNDLICYGYSASRTRKGLALKLGLQAIHRIIGLRTTKHFTAADPLPGEASEPSTPNYKSGQSWITQGGHHVALSK